MNPTDGLHGSLGAVAVADLVVLIPPGGSDPGNAMAMGSTFAMGAWGDALAISLMELRDYSWADFLFTHPGGRVGEQAKNLLEQLEEGC